MNGTIQPSRNPAVKARHDSHRLWAAASRCAKEKEYWLRRLADHPTPARFPCDYGPKQGQPVMEILDLELPPRLSARLVKMSGGSDTRLHMILAAGLTVLLAKYTGQDDILLGAPIYKQETAGEFTNTVLVLRNRLEPDMTFRQLILQVRQTISEAMENANYPLETFLYHLDADETATGDGFPLFDVALCLENIHHRHYLDGLNHNLCHLFNRRAEHIGWRVEYNSRLYRPGTIESQAAHFNNLLAKASLEVDRPLGHLDMLSAEERQEILYEFNGQRSRYPTDKTVLSLFAAPLRRVPHRIALVCGDESLTYLKLATGARQLSHLLVKRGIGRDSTVAVMLERSPSMALGILASWWAGGAYIPLDLKDPLTRRLGILNDAGSAALLTGAASLQPGLADRYEGDIIRLDGEGLPGEDSAGPRHLLTSPPAIDPASLAYIIYTSGSTGRPKGAMVEHGGMMNHLQAKIETLQLAESSVVAQNASHTFDISVWQFFSGLLSGGRTVIFPDPLILNPSRFISRLTDRRVTILEVVPSYLTALLDVLTSTAWNLDHLAYLLVTGEEVKESQVRQWFEHYPRVRMVNAYGPTEAADDISHYVMDAPPQLAEIPIGRPIGNLNIYIADGNRNLCPVGVPGEIWVSGIGVGRGYLNEPERTAQVFADDPYKGKRHNRLYKTGDLGTWHGDGNIKFLGRQDHQVKIRGFRVELAEIENKLFNHPVVKEAVVTVRQEGGSSYLCAYFRAGADIDGPELKQFLGRELPDYMVPAHFVRLDQFPLTPSGKIDRKALPTPDWQAVGRYTPPRDEVEQGLAAIWSQILNIDAGVIGIDAGFFDLGGQSLKAINLITRIHKEFNVKLQLAVIFDRQTIRQQAEYIAAAERENYVSIPRAPAKAYYVLSSAQKRMYILQQLDPGLTAYNMPMIHVLDVKIDKDRLEDTFKRLIHRHESLRTSFAVVDTDPCQEIHDTVEFAIEYHEPATREEVAQLQQSFVKPFDLSQAPLLRCGLIRLAEHKHILMVDMHHIVADGVSMDILFKDFMALYAGETLPELKIQYKDYAEWQNSPAQRRLAQSQEDFWTAEFKGRIPGLELPLDYERSERQSFAGDKILFRLEKRETARLAKIARTHDATMYMVLLAVYKILLSKITGQQDIIVGTPTMGRSNADLENLIGIFINTIAIRSRLPKENSFSAFLLELKEKTLKAFENQDYQFENLVEKVVAGRDMSRNPIIDVLFSFNNQNDLLRVSGAPDMPDIPHLYALPKVTSKFDLVLVANEDDDTIAMNLTYSSAIFKRATVQSIVNHFLRIVAQVAEDEHIRLADIVIDSEFAAARAAVTREMLEDFGF